jgi:hypothetical protein
VGLGLALAAQGKNDEAHSAYRRARMAGNLPDTLKEFVRAKLADSQSAGTANMLKSHELRERNQGMAQGLW